ncbi:histidine phosphatase family protein [Paenibacillus sp. N1-5-1-14]|uniref:histidine phosphatase family protein n=1 Tax=Paenibacillus radicibacter TaxID=2972488 RepID=UPI00215971FA|nr:histidine phosphatase family protein [Paenibacillus radicibacter]MCR8642268.1 histidine phosphatase family protein [Paenibacillus radicibacter]
MTTFGLVRHGSTEWNKLGKLQGQIDTHLTEEGREQATLLGKKLKSSDWDFIVSSNLLRAHETAEIISQYSGIPLHGTDPLLRERSFGECEGTTLSERLERWGEQWRTQDLGMEQDDVLFARWTAFADEWIANKPDARILVVSHGSYIGQAVRSLGLEEENGWITNTSLTIIHRDANAWSCSLYSCTKHLD